MNPSKLTIESIALALKEDKKTFPKKDLLTCSERNIVSYLRVSISKLLKSDGSFRCYQVDAEYNRVGLGDGPKNIKTNNDQKIIIPDIVIHKRGVEVNKDRLANYLCIEVKKIPLFRGSCEELKNKRYKERLKNDLEKLKRLRKSKCYKYQHVACLVFAKEKIFLNVDNSNFKDITAEIKNNVNSK